jgi:hypothetical protein
VPPDLGFVLAPDLVDLADDSLTWRNPAPHGSMPGVGVAIAIRISRTRVAQVAIRETSNQQSTALRACPSRDW